MLNLKIHLASKYNSTCTSLESQDVSLNITMSFLGEWTELFNKEAEKKVQK